MVDECVSTRKKLKAPQMMKVKRTRRVVELVVLLIVVVLIFALPLFAGTRSYPLTVVEGNSMMPTLQNGDLVYYTGCGTVENGSLIVFYQDNSGNPLLGGLTQPIVVHRVIDVSVGDDGFLYYKTKGDNNNLNDTGLVRFDSVLGVKAVVIPKVGFAFLFFKSPQGLIAVVGLVVVSYISVYESKLWKDKKKAAFLGQLAQKALNKEVPEEFYRKVELAVQNIENIDSAMLEDEDARALATWLKGSLGSEYKIRTVQCEKCHSRTVVLEGSKQTLLVGVSENGDCSGLVTLLKGKNQSFLACENCSGISCGSTDLGLTQSVLKFRQMTF